MIIYVTILAKDGSKVGEYWMDPEDDRDWDAFDLRCEDCWKAGQSILTMPVTNYGMYPS